MRSESSIVGISEWRFLITKAEVLCLNKGKVQRRQAVDMPTIARQGRLILFTKGGTSLVANIRIWAIQQNCTPLLPSLSQ